MIAFLLGVVIGAAIVQATLIYAWKTYGNKDV